MKTMISHSTTTSRRFPRLNLGTMWLLGWVMLAAWFGFGHEWLKHNPAPALASVQRSPVAPRQESRIATTPPKLETVAISSMKVGDQVPAENPTGEKDTAYGDTVDPPTWRKLTLLARKTDGSFADVQLLRPLVWLEEQQAETGGTVEVHAPECGIEGRAKIVSIEPCPPIQHDPNFRIVTGTFKHQAAQVLDIYIEGDDEPIGTTPNHPFWSEDRQTFVRADELKEGEHLRAFNGTPIVRRVVPLADPEPVFNLEVQCDHVYHVAKNGVLVHNSEPCPLNLVIGGGHAPGYPIHPPGTVLLDLSPRALPDIVADGRQMPFAAETFKNVLIERLNYEILDADFLRESARVLQSEGTLRGMTGVGANPKRLREALEAAGFTNIRVRRALDRIIEFEGTLP